jgi:uncharacterized protein
MFDAPLHLCLGLAVGMVFGFLLQKGQVTKFRVIVGQFLLRDFTMLRVMLTAIVVGAIGVYALRAAGLVALHPKPALLGGTVVGGLVFGVGMALLGYCPGTAVAAMAEGSRHAIAGVVGMLAGAACFAEVYGALARTVLAVADYGSATIPELTGLSPWILIAILAGATGALLMALHRPAAGGGVLGAHGARP